MGRALQDGTRKAIRAGVFQQELLITPDLKLLKDDRRKFEIRLQRLIRRIHVDPQDWVLFLDDVTANLPLW